MDLAETESDQSGQSVQFYNCFKVSSLSETILETTQVANLKDRYVLGERLGWGQFGVIRSCSDRLTGEMLACKSIAKDKLMTVDDVRSVKLEIEIMSRLLGHPNVVNLKAVYEEEDCVHLLMELCAGGELFHQLEKHGRFSESDARFIFRHLIQVVKYCHENGVVHRDLKPENILLATTSSSSPIKLADFGLATYIKPGQYLHGTVGSPFYIAPEVLAGGYNQAADVWSAGVILYILLSGMPPFWGKTKSRIFEAVRAADLRFPSNLWDNVSTSAKDLITRMLCMDPSKRLTAKEVLAHSWMKDAAQVSQEQEKLDARDFRWVETGISSLPAPFIVRNQDFSFSDGTAVICEDQMGHSPVFTCKSSFSSFLLDTGDTPSSVPGGFSFSSCVELDAATEFSSPIPKLPSFTFFSPCSTADQGNSSISFKANLSLSEALLEEPIKRKLSLLLEPIIPAKHKFGDMEWKETRKGGLGGSRATNIPSKRNHSIGLGELDQFNLIVTESVIRWASCTHIPTPPSLRLSLVC
ncbi:Calcium-dependent protein kinase 17 [Cucurbita argyrosperma subsp. argyrosperma]|nr:Calcium-dependent protein kinase 17 [Cucurbita argyrosperma subsp. argyrosperma]